MNRNRTGNNEIRNQGRSQGRSRGRLSHVVFMCFTILGVLLSMMILMTHNHLSKYFDDFRYNYAPSFIEQYHLFEDNKTMQKPREKGLLKQIETLKQEINEANEKIKMIEQPNDQDATNLESPNAVSSNTRDPQDICHPFPLMVPSATTLWTDHLAYIFNSSQHPRDPPYEFHDWTAILLHLITPERLLKSVKTLPDMEDIRFILEILQKRRLSLKEGGGPESPPLRILVMGGSVTMGVRCLENALNLKVGRFMRTGCAWPFRLEKFVNRLFGFEAIQVENMAVGGINTESATTIFEYGILPNAMKQPDVIINACSTNDMHYNTIMKADVDNVTLDEAVFDMTQRFMRSVIRSRNCRRRPILIYLDDYLGNEQNLILETMAFQKNMAMLSEYYNIMSISYADAVRHLVYGDTKEQWFHPPWYDNNGVYKREIHHPMEGHHVIMWVVAFNLLNSISIFCSLETFKKKNEYLQADEEGQYGYKSGNGMPVLKYNKKVKGGPLDRPPGMPPPLTKDILLQNVTNLWRSSSEVEDTECKFEMENEKDTDSAPCIFAWIAGMNEMKPPKRNPNNVVKQLDKKMTEIIQSNVGWESEFDHGKLGFIATKQGSNLVLELKDVLKPINVVHLMAMKSYGEKWKDSKIKVEIHEGKNVEELLEEMEIEGVHESETSVTYPYRIHLKKKVEVGGRLQVSIQLIGGNFFKFTGMAFCGNG